VCMIPLYSTACIGLLPCICHNCMYGLYGQYLHTYYMQVVLSGPSSPVWTSQDPHPIPGHGPSINRSIDQPINRHSLPTVQCLPTYLTLVASYIHPVLPSPEPPFSLSSPPQTVPLVTGRPSQRRAATSNLFAHILSRGSLSTFSWARPRPWRYGRGAPG
jgi:hypothetical protein